MIACADGITPRCHAFSLPANDVSADTLHYGHYADIAIVYFTLRRHAGCHFTLAITPPLAFTSDLLFTLRYCR